MTIISYVITVYLFDVFIDFNLIPTFFETKEGMLNMAENCYKRSLELETNDRNKNNLNRRIGNVYNEITSGYIEEIASKFLYCCTFLLYIDFTVYIFMSYYFHSRFTRTN